MEGCDCMNIGETIRNARKRQGLSAKQLADMVGTFDSSILRIERGKCSLTFRTAEKIFSALGLKIVIESSDNDASNPYWNNITSIAEKQRSKGIKEYGQGIELNPADAITRLTYLEEELVDSLMYIEWIKDKLNEMKGE